MEAVIETPHQVIEHQAAESYGGTTSNRLIAGWEIASVLLSFLTVAWISQPFAAGRMLGTVVPLGLAFLFIFLSHRARKETAREIGWRLDNFFHAVRVLIIPMAAGAMVLSIIGWFTGGFHGQKFHHPVWIVWLPLWGLIQQYPLQGFFNRRAQIVFGKGWVSVALVALIFALLHLPNLWLSLATLVGGVLWAAVYQRVPNLFALGLSHGMMSAFLIWSIPAPMLHSLRVGFNYFG